MTTNPPDPEQPSSTSDDLMTRRLNSRPSAPEPASVEAPAGTPSSSERPDLLSEDEWAALVDDSPAPQGPPPVSASAPREVRNVPTGRGATGWLPGLARVWIAVSTPLVLIALSIRLVLTALFQHFEYFWRPGFPADQFGFSAVDRQHYGSYVVDYLLNWDGIRFLGDLKFPDGKPAFLQSELAHMQDVKTLVMTFFVIATFLAVVSVFFAIYLHRRTARGMRSALFSGGIVTLVFIIGVGVLASLGWEQFFTRFHEVFFKNGTWTFYTNDTLIRLYPQTYWTDAGILIGASTVIVAILFVIFAWPRRRRNASDDVR